MENVKRRLALILTPILLLFSSGLFSQTVMADSATELKNVITDVSIWDVNNGSEATKTDGTYQLVKNNEYRFETSFDLSAYDGNLKDGDYFTFTVPEPFTVSDTTFELKDEKTGLAVGDVVVTSNGEGQGATVKITLKNLAEYLNKTGGTQVQGIKGTFYTGFTVKEEVSSKTVTFDSTETNKTISQVITVKKPGGTDYTDTINKENYNKIGGVMKKEAWSSTILNKSGEYLHNWTMRVNTNQQTYDTITVNDVIPDDSAPMQFIPEKMKVVAGYFNSNFNLTDTVTLEEGKDYEIEYNSSYTGFTIKILNASTRLASNGKPAAYNIFYSTTSPANGTDVINTMTVKGNDTNLTINKTTKNTEQKVTRSTKITTGGTIQLDTGYRITLYKQDAETGNLINGAEFEITSPNGDKETIKIEKDGVAQSKVYSSEEVAKGKFTIIETKAPAGYVLDSTPIEVTVGESGVIRTIKNTKEKISIPVTKVWEDGNNQDNKRPTSVTVQLYANGEKVDGQTLTLRDDNNWTAQFENLNKTDDNGKEITYAVKESDVVGYTSVVSGDATSGYTITNTYTPETVEVSGTKTWNDKDNQDGVRPDSITVHLVKTVNGVESIVDSKEVTADDDWKYSFTNLPKYESGAEITYSLKEEAVSSYETDINGYDITNTHTPSTTSVSGTKTWDDNDDQDGKRPTSITVNLLANGKKVDSQTVTADNNWIYSFDNLPEYQKGEKLTYTVSEDTVTDYSTTVSGYDITNSYTPGKTAMSVTKVWKDGDNQDGKRPTSITVQLYADGKAVEGKTLELTADNNWQGQFTDLALKSKGKNITYTVKEISDLSDYESTVSYDDTKTSATITNSYTPETVDVSGTKAWKDGDNQDGKRPDSITVNLLANGEKVDSQTVTADNNWTYSFTNLDKYKDGQEITYTVEEDSVEGYTATVDGYNITNTYTPATVDISGTKTWSDSDNQDGKRPDSIIVNLLANGEKVDSQTVTTDSNWAYSFTNLPQYKNGQRLVYTVSEDSVDGYSTSIDGYNITNSYTPETVDVTATKNWDDADNQDGKRPTSITINLLADGEKVDSQEVTASEDGKWTASFTNLPKYKNGNEIKYTVTEEAVKEYETTIDDFTITNKHVPKAIEYKVTKIWNDNNNQDGKRPDSVTVQLYKSVNGSTPVAVEGKTLTITADDKTDDNTWVASFTNLPQFEKGQEITYSVQETDVADGYTASVSGQMITNSHTPDTVVISGTKVWDDNNNQDGKRTTSVKVQILKGEEVVDEIEVSEAINWAFESKALPKYENGKEITYTVKEVAVTAYETKIEKADNGQYTITNTHTPEKISLSGQKTWNDNGNQDGIRPDSITVELLANGESTGQTATASEATAWQYTFDNLDRYKDEKEIDYSVKEVNTPDGYTPEVDGMNITNTHIPTIPNTPTTPNTPSSSSPSASSNETTKGEKASSSSSLPATGEKSSLKLIVLGIMLIIATISGMIYYKSRKM